MKLTLPFIHKTSNNSSSKDNEKPHSPHFSVSTKLNFVNVLILISSLLSIVGVYEIQLGGKMHELNYLHQKYITALVKSVKEFETNSDSLTNVKKNILLVRDQPIECINLVGPIESFMMRLIGTEDTVDICQKDLEIANDLLDDIQAFNRNTTDKRTLINSLYLGIEKFENSGIQFEPLVGKTVKVTFFIVITVVIGKAFVVPIIGFFLSNSVARDYLLLTKTKNNLEREKKRSALIQSEKIASLTTMVAGMSHEINTPVGASLTANSYSSELLSNLQRAYETDKLTEDEFYNFINEMEKINKILTSNLSRTASLVKSFKQVSVNQTVDELQTINLKEHIEQILTSLTPITKKHPRISIELSCDNNIQAHVYSGALGQIITNLITNAINHAFCNNKQGTLTITSQLSSKNEIFMSVEDDGCGISEIDKVHIFDPFFTTKRSDGGTGLGLHILHNLVVDKLKGRVLCTSELNKGTRFDIYFPQTINLKD